MQAAQSELTDAVAKATGIAAAAGKLDAKVKGLQSQIDTVTGEFVQTEQLAETAQHGITIAQNGSAIATVDLLDAESGAATSAANAEISGAEAAAASTSATSLHQMAHSLATTESSIVAEDGEISDAGKAALEEARATGAVAQAKVDEANRNVTALETSLEETKDQSAEVKQEVELSNSQQSAVLNRKISEHQAAMSAVNQLRVASNRTNAAYHKAAAVAEGLEAEAAVPVVVQLHMTGMDADKERRFMSNPRSPLRAPFKQGVVAALSSVKSEDAVRIQEVEPELQDVCQKALGVDLCLRISLELTMKDKTAADAAVIEADSRFNDNSGEGGFANQLKLKYEESGNYVQATVHVDEADIKIIPPEEVR